MVRKEYAPRRGAENGDVNRGSQSQLENQRVHITARSSWGQSAHQNFPNVGSLFMDFLKRKNPLDL